MSDGSSNLHSIERSMKVRGSAAPAELTLHPLFSAGVSRYVVQRGDVLRSIISDYKDVMKDIINTQCILRGAARALESYITLSHQSASEIEVMSGRLRQIGELARTIEAATGPILLHFNGVLRVALCELVEFAGQLPASKSSQASHYDGSRIVEGILKSSELVLAQIDNMLEVLNLENSQATPHGRAVGVQGLVNRLERQALPFARSKDVQLKTSVSSQIDKCWLDEQWLERCLQTVLQNIISVSPRGAVVTIETGLSGPRTVEMSISTSEHQASSEEAQAALMFLGAHDRLYTEHQKGRPIASVLEKFLLRALGVSASAMSMPGCGVGTTILLEAYWDGD